MTQPTPGLEQGLTTLLERVMRAPGPDRELDYAISRFADGELARHSSLHLPYTASIDAALALVERKLPGWTVANLSQQDDKTWYCELREGHLTSYSRVAASNVTYGHRPANLPLAILAALLGALSRANGEQP
jgi:hypothetical protein